MSGDDDQQPRAGASRTEHLTVSRHGAVAVVRIDRPSRRNALTMRMWQDIPATLALACQPDTRCVVITGAGGDFSAGADVSEFGTLRAGEAAERYAAAVTGAVQAVAQVPVPTIAAIDGYCVGGGCEIAVACDIRLASERARIGVTAAKLGVVYSLASTRRLAALVGLGWARYLLLSATLLPAQRALPIGLVHEVHTSESVLPAALDLARHVAELGAQSLAGAGRILDAIGAGVAKQDGSLAALHAQSFRSPECQQRVQAFLDRRQARPTSP